MMNDRGIIEFSDGTDAVEFSDGRFVFNSVPTLQELASCEISLKIWLEFIGQFRINDWRLTEDDYKPLLNRSFHYYLRNVNNFIELRRAPPLIEQMIKHQLMTILGEMDKCVKHFDRLFFFGLRKYATKLFHPKFIVWSQNSKIDYKRTALKMISCNLNLTPIQKFIIMSKYCLEYDLESFSAAELSEEFIEEATFKKDYLVFYWICYLRNELYKMPFENYSSIDVAMATFCHDDEWVAFEYFWNRLDPDDQVSIAAIKLRRWEQHQNKLISRMSELQQYRVFSQLSTDHILAFGIRLDMRKIAFAIWLVNRSSMSETDFVNLVSDLVDRAFSCDDTMLLLIDVWNSAPDRHKDYFLRRSVNIILTVVYYHSEEYSISGLKFLQTVLSLTDEQFKKEMARSRFRECCNVKYPHLWMKVMQWCLPSEGEVMEFKKSLTNSSTMLNRCIKLLHNEEFDKCYELFDAYSPNSLATCELMQRILQSDEFHTESFILNHRKWNKLSEFVDKAYLGDSLLTSSMKKNFLSKFAANFPNEIYDKTILNEMTKVVQQVLLPEEIAAFKQTLLDAFQRICSTQWWWLFIERKYSYLNDFIRWCLGDATKLSEFKKTMKVDDIFERNCAFIRNNYPSRNLSRSILSDELRNVDSCLTWCFNSEEEVKKYKVRKIYESELDLIHLFLENSDKQSLTELLMWFFDNDVNAIRKFRLKKLKNMLKR